MTDRQTNPDQPITERTIRALRSATLTTMAGRGAAMIAMADAADLIERQSAALKRLARLAQEEANV